MVNFGKSAKSARSAISKRFQKGRASTTSSSKLSNKACVSSFPLSDSAEGASPSILPEASPELDEGDVSSPSNNAKSHGQGQAASPPVTTVATPVMNESGDLSGTVQNSDKVNTHGVQSPQTDTSAPTSTPSRSMEAHAQLLWNIAYDRILKKNPDLLHWYERIVSGYAMNGLPTQLISHHSSGAGMSRDAASPTDHEARQRLMDGYLDGFLGDPPANLSGSAKNGDDADSDLSQEIDDMEDEAEDLHLFSEHSQDPRVEVLVQLYEAVLSYLISVVRCQPGTPQWLIKIDFKTAENDIRERRKAFMSFDGKAVRTLLTQRLLEIATELSEDSLTPPDDSSESSAQSDSTQLTDWLEGLNVTEEPNQVLDPDNGPEFDLLYNWMCGTRQYREFITSTSVSDERVLWLKGDHGAGKTRLLQAVLHGLKKGNPSTSAETTKVAYFFCDGSCPWRENALSAVKALVYHIIRDQPCLQDHLISKFIETDREEFDGVNDFYAVATVLYSLLTDERLEPTYFIVDEIEELNLSIPLMGEDLTIFLH
ncbi:hypothetical protein F4802DRAFT_613653 [Xylaria palmicola]|nr:hypothetical protein F4802DRAFT_613653 [Xylaria palmicola]